MSICAILFVFASSAAVLAYPAMIQDLSKQVEPDISEFTDYLIPPTGDSDQVAHAPSSHEPKFDFIPPAKMISDILPATLGVLDTLDPNIPINSGSDLAGSTATGLTGVGPLPSNPSTLVLYSSTLSSEFDSITATSSLLSSTSSISVPERASAMPNQGPGLVIPTAAWEVPVSSSLNAIQAQASTVALADVPSATSVFHDAEGAAPGSFSHRIPIIIGGVLLGLLAFSLFTCVLLNTRHLRNKLFVRGVHRDLDSRIARELEKSDIESNPSTVASSQSPSSLSAWMKLPSQISPFSNHRDSLLSYFRSHQVRSQIRKNPPKEKVLDIVSDFPRSRFSVTSSDYTHSIRSVDSNRHLDVPPPKQSVPLLPPEEFFSLPSSTTLVSRHSRTGSAPVFGRLRREAGLSLALSRARMLEQEEEASKTAKSRPKSMAIARDRVLQRRRIQSVAVVGNGEWF